MSANLPNDSFCIAPWVHTFISPHSKRKLCCMSLEEQDLSPESKYDPITLKEHWNSDSMRAIRLKFLQGEVPSQCRPCFDKKSYKESYRYHFNEEMFPAIIDEVIQATDTSGCLSLNPRSFDYRVSNNCNFKCRMCGDTLSSAWENESRTHRTWTPQTHPWLDTKIGNEIRRFQKDIAEKEFFNALYSGEVEEIYWSGGEPLLWDMHWQAMQFLIDADFAKNVTTRYNTNLSVIEWRKRNLFHDILPHFKHSTVLASLDGVGELGEYIRSGFNWNTWKTNFLQAKKRFSESSNIEFIIDITITLPGLMGAIELFDFINSENTQVDVRYVSPTAGNLLMSPLTLPKEIRKNIIDKILFHIFPKLNHNNFNFAKTLIDIKNKDDLDISFDSIKKEKDQFLKLEVIRKETLIFSEIVKKNFLLEKWWNDI